MKIYKLQHKDGRFYIGSTMSDLNSRFQKHKSNGLVKEFISCWDEVTIELLEIVTCETRKELNRKEQEYIDKLRTNLCLNKIRASRRTRHEEFKETYEKIKGTDKDYYAKYREKNREKNKEYSKQYYLKNKERILKEMKEKYKSNVGHELTYEHVVKQ